MFRIENNRMYALEKDNKVLLWHNTQIECLRQLINIVGNITLKEAISLNYKITPQLFD